MLLQESSPQDPKAVTKCEEFVESQFVLPEGGPLEEVSFCTGGSNRIFMVTTDTRRHDEMMVG